MTIRNSLALACVLSAFALPVSAQTCTPEDAMRRAEVAAETINRIADNNPEKAAALHEKLLKFQERDPTRDRHSACEAYDRIIAELERKDEQTN
ncbi:hypothetical protein HG264_01695 [Pseudomonas sp. gcc21]|uniref:hypothetical protein n=1 Tax=Pseudomonas sp. gcc21 TaxID=2726989 RepID=UPI00145109E3|nr:hypothetical protein [Pseudomonas sp. gcc21]QJD57710.1 hypothetical protein HG264_01695 [Pseudomonas sp. gcc21]